MDTHTRKDGIRRLVLARRGRLDPDERAARAAAATAHLAGLPEFAAAGAVLAFASIATEMPTAPLLEAVLGAGKELMLPWVADDGSLRAAVVGSLADLAPGYRGIPEPRARMPLDPARAGCIVVPGVAFDARGGRLGYGGGFYDRFLRAVPEPPRIGLCFEVQIVDEIPMSEHDEPVDVVVTDERVVRSGAREIRR